MQPNVKFLTDKIEENREGSYDNLQGLLQYPTALDFLANCLGNREALIFIANDFILRLCNIHKVDIVSFASFFPNLSSDPGTVPAKLTRDAICFLAELALKLREPSYGHDKLNTIEVVVGALVNEPKINPDTKEIDVNIINESTARKNIINNLIRVMDEIQKLYPNPHDSEFTPLTIALEIEPGPLYAINSFDSIGKFCSELDQEQKKHDCLKHVGLNLDIAHWNIILFQSQLDPMEIAATLQRDHPHVFRRICHAHFSGYHRSAHFGDLSIKGGEANSSSPVKNMLGDMSPWIELLWERMKDQQHLELYKNYPNYSGYIISELEATSKTDHVTQTINNLQTQFKKLNCVFCGKM